MSCRNGRFLLQSSRNILEPSVLIECEEALNQGSMTAAEVFISLRSKSILHLFASIGRFLGLEVNICSFCIHFEEVKSDQYLYLQLHRSCVQLYISLSSFQQRFLLIILKKLTASVRILKAVKFRSCRFMSMVLLQLKYPRTLRMVRLCC